MCPFKNVAVLTPVAANVTLYGNRVFADIIKVRLKVRPPLIRVDPNSNKSVLIKVRKTEDRV